MADVLSQQEIDALLSALNSGELAASEVTEKKQKIKVYDFKHAMRYSKEQLRSITRIHENFTRSLTSNLSAQLRTFVEIEIELVEQVNYQEFIASIPSRTILNIFDVQPMNGKMVMEINPQVAYAVLERMLGGQGYPAERDGALTEIETVLIQKVFSGAFDRYENVWESIENIKVRWEAMESNPQFMQIASPNETVIVIALRTTIGEITGRMTLCIPHLIVEPMLPKLTAHQWFASMTKTEVPKQHDLLKKNLDDVQIPIIAELGRAKLAVKDLLNLQIGDVIGIETGKLQVKADHLTRFLGDPGLLNGHYAVRIDQVIYSEGDDV